MIDFQLLKIEDQEEFIKPFGHGAPRPGGGGGIVRGAAGCASP